MLLLLLISALPAAPIARAEEWKFLYKEEAIEVWSNGKSPPTFRAEGDLDVDLVDILAVFADIPRRAEWVRSLAESRVIFDNHDDRFVVYSRYDLPWPTSDRDSIIESKLIKDYEKQELTINFAAIEVSGEKPLAGVIRLRHADGSLFLRSLAVDRTHVRYELTLDPEGWLPQWVCNYFTQDAPIEMLKRMRIRIRETQELYKDFRAEQSRLWHKSTYDPPPSR